MNPAALLLVGLAVLFAVAAFDAAVDRHARAAAWRQIALERRWNYEQRREQERRGRRDEMPGPRPPVF